MQSPYLCPVKKPWEISIADFTYSLPPDRIAQFPLSDREASKLLYFNGQDIISKTFLDIPSFLPPQSLLVLNATKVVKARLLFSNSTGGKIEVFCLEPISQLPSVALESSHSTVWKTMVGGLKKWKNETLFLEISGPPSIVLKAKKQAEQGNIVTIEFSWEPSDLSFAEVLEAAGKVPLPPYMKREVEKSDENRYQTTYNKFPGSVAAPTAGLHFTTQVLDRIRQVGHHTAELCLHVGAGTFAPVKADKMEEHPMHAEWFEVEMSVLESLKNQGDYPVVAVGTTSLRTLETLYWLGVKVSQGIDFQSSAYCLSQWEPYQLNSTLSFSESLNFLINYLNSKALKSIIGQTQILIAPGYEFKVVNALVTNFHQPNSTLLLLIAAFIGESWRKVYEFALENEYRFLSYGDSSLLIKPTT
jgi:S-adenosylmethionine:tRNA ribosyltransferase-isomerase